MGNLNGLTFCTVLLASVVDEKISQRAQSVIMKNNVNHNLYFSIYILFYFYFLQELLVQHVPPNVFWNFARISHDSQSCTQT